MDELEYFSRSEEECTKHLERLNNPDFKNKRVLDLGCGQGVLCIMIANLGAKEIVGLDIDKDRIDFAIDNLKRNHPDLVNKISFLYTEDQLDKEEPFDIIISKDTFEHIVPIEPIFEYTYKKLKKSGQLMVGFAPLYHTPYGDHKRTEALVPWGHLIFPENFLINRLNKRNGTDLKKIEDLGLNKMSINELKKYIEESKFNIVYFQTNKSKNPILFLFAILSKIAFLEKFFTHNVYFILEKK